MNTDNKALVEFITTKYLEYTHERNLKYYPDKIQSWDEYHTQTIKVFWEKIADYPRYAEESANNLKKYGRKLMQDTSSNPDIDYACRYAGINSDWIVSLQCEFFYGRK